MHSCIFYISIFFPFTQQWFSSLLLLFSCWLPFVVSLLMSFIQIYSVYFPISLFILLLLFLSFTFFSILTHSVLCFVSFLFLFVALVPCLTSLLHCSVLLHCFFPFIVCVYVHSVCTPVCRCGGERKDAAESDSSCSALPFLLPGLFFLVSSILPSLLSSSPSG